MRRKGSSKSITLIKSVKSEGGQVLLVLVMLLATTITIVLTSSFSSTTNTKTAKLEEESQKALAAAEAGIDQALLQGSDADISTITGVPGFQGTANISEVNASNFTSPLLQKDEEYTFYLSAYNTATNAFSSPYTGIVTLYYANGSTSCVAGALEITLIYDTSPNYKVKRFISDVGNLYGGSVVDNIGVNSGGTVDGTTYNCHTNGINMASYPNAKLLIIKSLLISTKIGISGNVALPAQGRTVVSEARSPNTGVTKKVQLFQSYPQIPSDFFVTRF